MGAVVIAVWREAAILGGGFAVAAVLSGVAIWFEVSLFEKRLRRGDDE